MLDLQEAGAKALPIITLISFLVGVIMAFVGAIQLQKFGAAIYVADLVGIAVVREMGAMMTGIVMSGRTGAAFAAQIGTMKANQEVDAIATMGISPIEFLVLPRVLALSLMMPLLCLYADLVGILGGAVIASGMLELGIRTYCNEVFYAVSLTNLAGGVFKASAFCKEGRSRSAGGPTRGCSPSFPRLRGRRQCRPLSNDVAVHRPLQRRVSGVLACRCVYTRRARQPTTAGGVYVASIVRCQLCQLCQLCQPVSLLVNTAGAVTVRSRRRGVPNKPLQPTRAAQASVKRAVARSGPRG